MPDQPTRPEFPEPDEVLVLATLATASVFAVFAIACRWFIDYQGQNLQLLLVAGSLTAAVILLRRSGRAGLPESLAKGVFAVCTLTALWLWSPGFAFSVLLGLPVAASLGLPPLLQKLGLAASIAHPAIDTSGQTAGRRPPAVRGAVDHTDSVNSDLPGNTDLPATVITAESHLPAEAATSDGHPGEGSAALLQDTDPDCDPWELVHMQFARDAALIRNVTYREQADGSCSVVALIRCRFANGRETRVLHLPFWPLLERAPEVYCRVASGPEIAIKTTEQRPHGLRLELRREDRDAEHPLEVVIEVVASVEAEASEHAA
jgi:hypothetical protein